MQNLENMEDTEAQTLLNLINQIMRISEAETDHGNQECFAIYKMARDARDLMMFDTLSRETMRKLSNPEIIANGLVINAAVIEYIRAGRTIDAIRELRGYTGAGLREAKDAVESLWNRYALSSL